MTTLGTRNGAFQQHQTTLRIDTHNLKVLLGAGDSTHMAGHALARDNSTRILRHAARARHVVRTRVAMGGALRYEVVAIDGARKALTLRHTGNIHLLPRLKHLDRNRGARLV